MAAYSAVLRGASTIYVVDRVPERLATAEKIGCVAIDFTKSDPVEQIIERNGGMVDRAIDAVGYQAVDQSGSTEKANIVLQQCVRVVRACGGICVPGLYLPADPGAADEQSKEGNILIPFGKMFEKVGFALLQTLLLICLNRFTEDHFADVVAGSLDRNRSMQRESI